MCHKGAPRFAEIAMQQGGINYKGASRPRLVASHARRGAGRAEQTTKHRRTDTKPPVTYHSGIGRLRAVLRASHCSAIAPP